MRLLVALGSIPLLVWILVAVGWNYYEYSNWQTEIYEPLEGRRVTAEQELQRLIAQNKAADEFRKERERRFQEIQDLELRLRATSDLIPRTSKMSEILRDLANISDKAGLEFSSFKPAPEFAEDFLRIVPIEVELRGSYTQVMSFLDESSHLKKVIASKNLELGKPEMGPGSSTISARATLHSYYIESDSDAQAREKAQNQKQEDKASTKSKTSSKAPSKAGEGR